MNLAQSEFLNVKYFIVALVLLGTVIFVALAKNISQEPSTKIKNPRIVVKKRERVLELFDSEKLVKTYKVALGFAPEGDKEKQGDGKTPEGEFYIFTRNPKSKFYLSLGVSYPSAEDAERGLQTKLITKKEHDAIIKAINEKRTPPQYTALGGEIYIHGGGIGKDWTFGCVALENEEIKELYGIIPVGAPVTIQP
jgi:murein L,D-transpeptidase YafK